ncbi:MAG TPA: alpha/beta hydrolase fold domain-containing protein [Streptosporangiaceae bacterium]|nr:alpha/beta hydrolase fold domain-containing protein [Streptosporangiaceae bacterium]
MPINRTAELQLRGRAGTLQGRVYWPGASSAPHGRLLVFWTVADDGAWCRELSASADLVVLAVTCGRAYPADLEQAVTAAEWAAENAARLDADPGELLVGGTGPGGTLAAAVARHARAARWPAVGRQVLVCPGPVDRMPPSLADVAPATAVTVEHDPEGDEGRYAALLRDDGIAVDELRYAAPDAASAVRIRDGRQLLTELAAALRASTDD